MKLPVPLPSRIVTLLELSSPSARSGLPSRLKSPTVSAIGLVLPTPGESPRCVKPPIPLPSRIVTLLEFKFAVARSGLPSRLKSPTATR